MRIPSGVVDQVIFFVAVDSTDLKTRETGLTTFTVYRARDTGAATVFTTPTVAELSAANMPGVYSLLLDEDMTIAAGNDSEEMVFHITQASMAPVTRSIELYRPKITAGNTLDVTATGAAGIDWANVEGQGTTVGLTATTVATVTTTTTATNLTNAPTAGDLTATMKTSVENAVLNADMTGHQTLGTLGQAIGDPVADTNTIYKAVVTDAAGATVGVDIVAIQADTDNIQTRLPAALVGGRMDSDVAVIQANVITATAINADAITAAKLAADVTTEINAVASGTADSGTTTTMVDAARTEADTDYWKDMMILFTSGTISGQARLITAFTPGTDTITFTPATTQAVGTNTYEIIRNVAAAGASAPTAAEVADAVWDEDATAHQTLGTFGQAIGDPVADTNTIYKAVVTDATGATVGVDVVAVKADTAAILVDTGTTGVPVSTGGIASTSFAAGAIDAAAIAADAITNSELAQSAAQEIADEILNRDIAGGASGNTRNVRNALRAIRNKVSEAGGTLTVTQEDDVTPAWTAAVTRTAATNPITGVDPV